MQFSIPIDLARVEQAEAEMSEIIFQQLLSDTQKIWTLNAQFDAKVQPILRRIGLVLCGFGLAVMGLIVIYSGLVCFVLAPGSPGNCKDFSMGMMYGVIFTVGLAFFYFVPFLSRKSNEYIKWVQDAGGSRLCRALARKAIKPARDSVPYQAAYQLTDGTLQYSRSQAGTAELAWSKPLSGVAIYGDSLTVFFERWTDVRPIMIVLHQDFSQLEPLLTRCSIPFRAKGDRPSDGVQNHPC